jgi:uncharacterized protein YprB with RNaseH-like and TPR domain
VDLTSRLRAIVRPGPARPPRELTYEPEPRGYEASVQPSRVGEILGGRPIPTSFGECLVIDRRYESDRRHGGVLIGDCELTGADGLRLLDPSLAASGSGSLDARMPRTVFVDLETTGLSGGAGTVAFLVGCGFFDLGAFQVRQFLLTSFAGERALLAAVSEFFDDADLIVTYNGKTFDFPVMETRWLFHRMQKPLEGVAHFDMLHPARRLWKARPASADEGGCRLTTLERALFDVRRAGDVPGLDIPSRFFQFLRSGNPRPLEPVLEHNRLDLVSLAAVTARAARLAEEGADACRDAAEALALGRVYDYAGARARAEACYRYASTSDAKDSVVRAEALYRLGLGYRRDRRFAEAAECWRALVAVTEPRSVRRNVAMGPLRQFAVEALAIHHEHRDRDLAAARELAQSGLEETGQTGGRRAADYRHRLARLERKIARKGNAQLLWS